MLPLDASGLHGIFALMAFMFFNVEAIAVGTLVNGPMRVASWVAGLIGIGFVVLMVIGDAGNPGVFGPIGHGGAERMIVYPVMLWLMAFGGYLMASGYESTIGDEDRPGVQCKSHHERRACDDRDPSRDPPGQEQVGDRAAVSAELLRQRGQRADLVVADVDPRFRDRDAESVGAAAAVDLPRAIPHEQRDRRAD